MLPKVMLNFERSAMPSFVSAMPRRASAAAVFLCVVHSLMGCSPETMELTMGIPDVRHGPAACATIAPSGGQTAYILRDPSNNYAGKAVLLVPPFAVSESTTICASYAEFKPSDDEKILGPAVSFTPYPFQFNRLVHLQLPYDPSMVPAQGAELSMIHQPAAPSDSPYSDVVALDPVKRLATTAITSLGIHQLVVTNNANLDATTNLLDILFIIDNSPSMATKQQALVRNIPRFFNLLEELRSVNSKLDYHIGIATSDVGTVPPGRTPWGVPFDGCNSVDGDNGTLQAIPCTARALPTADSRNACAALCPNSSFDLGGSKFIAIGPAGTNVSGLDPARAFQCMALVGDGGCGIEGHLESMKRAITPGRNPGFLRLGALLAVIIIADEDDASAMGPDRQLFDPKEISCPLGSADSNPFCYNPDYRSFAFSTECMEQMTLPGRKHNCRERILPRSPRLEDVETYVAALQRSDPALSGVRPASRRLVSGIWSLTEAIDPTTGKSVLVPATSSLANVVINEGLGGPTTQYLNRAGGIDAACADKDNLSIYGQPQHRLSRFACQLAGSLQQSICKTDQWQLALENIFWAIRKKIVMSRLPPGEALDYACTGG